MGGGGGGDYDLCDRCAFDNDRCVRGNLMFTICVIVVGCGGGGGGGGDGGGAGCCGGGGVWWVVVVVAVVMMIYVIGACLPSSPYWKNELCHIYKRG